MTAYVEQIGFCQIRVNLIERCLQIDRLFLSNDQAGRRALARSVDRALAVLRAHILYHCPSLLVVKAATRLPTGSSTDVSEAKRIWHRNCMPSSRREARGNRRENGKSNTRPP